MKTKSYTIIAIFALFCIANIQAKTESIKPKLGSIQRSFTELARTRLDKVYDINMPLSGELERIDLEPGDKITKGEIIIQLVQTPWKQALNKAEAELKTIQHSYAYQARELARHEKLGPQKFVTEAAIDEARTKEKTLAAELKQAKAHVALAKYDLDKSVIHAPITGVVLKRYTQGGKWLGVGEPLLQLGDTNNLEVVAEALTQDAQLLKINDSVVLTSIGSPMILQGKIERIDPAGFTKKSALGVDEQRVNVIIKIINHQAAKLGVGYRLEAQFLVGSKEKNKIIAPRFSVLQDSDGNFYVFKVVNNKLVKQIVKPGINTDQEIAITSGLSTSDVIIAQPDANMHTGMKL